MDHRATLLQLTHLWLAGTPASRQAFDELLASALRQRGSGWARSPRGFSMGGGSLEHVVWDGFFSKLIDSKYQNTETVAAIAAYVGHQRPYVGRVYISSDLRPEMSEGQRAVCEEAADFLRAAQDEEYMLRTARADAEARWERLVAAWDTLPLAPAWEQRSVCDEVLRQVFDLLISQLYLPGGRLEIWPRGSYRDLVDSGARAPAPSQSAGAGSLGPTGAWSADGNRSRTTLLALRRGAHGVLTHLSRPV